MYMAYLITFFNGNAILLIAKWLNHIVSPVAIATY